MTRYDIWKTASPPEWDEEDDDPTAEDIGDARDHELRDDREG